MAARARQRGTRVFIPYLPWDAPGECRHGDPPVAARELARVVADISDSHRTQEGVSQTVPKATLRKIVVVKLGYLFPALREMASQAFMLLSPGCTDLRLAALPLQCLRRPIVPLDDGGDWHP